ncbi:hypothetical protein [Subtercola boreus]|uniref:hypothetical protein n=1 Tax=Subtercola boreus TaxID=120213 RepID=UPI000E2EBB53|nr:hypothetical protein [Subtercola boreus]
MNASSQQALRRPAPRRVVVLLVMLVAFLFAGLMARPAGSALQLPDAATSAAAVSSAAATAAVSAAAAAPVSSAETSDRSLTAAPDRAASPTPDHTVRAAADRTHVQSPWLRDARARHPAGPEAAAAAPAIASGTVSTLDAHAALRASAAAAAANTDGERPAGRTVTLLLSINRT